MLKDDYVKLKDKNMRYKHSDALLKRRVIRLEQEKQSWQSLDLEPRDKKCKKIEDKSAAAASHSQA